jgi:hypothetical protein
VDRRPALSPSPNIRFADLAAAACPSYGDLLAALECEFRSVGREALDESLDELALPLFEVRGAALEERAIALGRAAWAALPDEAATPPAWLLGSALRQRCGAAPVRAALAAELARRAGMAAHPTRLRGCWAIHVPGEPVGIAVDVGADSGTQCAGGPLGCVCAHQLASVVITSLADAWEAAGNIAQARHARVLRLALAHEGAA